MRKILSAMLAASLLLPILFITPASGEITPQTGNCSIASIQFYAGSHQDGSSATYCWRGDNTGDYEMFRYNRVTGNLGPLLDGTYKNDFSTSIFLSEIDSINFYDNPNDQWNVAACTYWGERWVDPQAFVYASGAYTLPAGDTHSFAWTSATSSSGCP